MTTTQPAAPSERVDLATSGEKTQASYTRISNAVLKHPYLSATAKLTYCILLSYAWFHNMIYPGQETLARDISKTARTVRRHLKELESFQLLTIKRRGQGYTNLYILHEYVPLDRTKTLHTDRTETTYPERSEIAIEEHEDRPHTEDERSNVSTHQEEISFSGQMAIRKETTPTPVLVSPQPPVSNDTPSSDQSKKPKEQGAGEREKPAKAVEEVTEEEAATIATYIDQYSRILGDHQHVKSNITQAITIYQHGRHTYTDFTLDDFIQLMASARELAQQTTIRKYNQNGSINRIPYYFQVMRNHLGMQPNKRTLVTF